MDIGFTRTELIHIYGRTLEELITFELASHEVNDGGRADHLLSILNKIEIADANYDWTSFAAFMRKTYMKKQKN